jgi:hypothetical protein
MTLIALAGATAALLGATAALGPASAGAVVNEQHDCTSLPFDEWLSCLAENAGGGFVGGAGGGGAAGGGAGAGAPTGGGSDDTDAGDSELGGNDGTYGTGTYSSQSVWDKIVSQYQGDIHALDFVADEQLKVRQKECDRFARQERRVRDEIGDEVRAGGSMNGNQRGRLRVIRIGWRYFECDELWSAGD